MKPFLQGRKSIDISPLRVPPGLASATATPSCEKSRANAAAASTGGSPGAPTSSVEVIKEGDKVVRLIVTCVCGERVEVECLYPVGS